MPRPAPPIAIGARMLGYTIISFEGICEECGGPMAVAQKPSPNTGLPMTTRGCPMCRKARKNQYDREASRDKTRRHPPIPYRDEDSEGFNYIEHLWSEKADRKIREFWEARGMTEESAREKFRSKCGMPWLKKGQE